MPLLLQQGLFAVAAWVGRLGGVECAAASIVSFADVVLLPEDGSKLNCTDVID